MDLKQTQETFWQLTQEPQGVEKAVQKIAQTPKAPFHHLKEFIRGDTEEESVEKMEIYSNMYFLRLHDILKEDFATIFSILGEENFYDLCVDYLQRHPSDSYDISLIGRRFASFIQEHKLTKEYPFLTDLVEIEWQRIEIFVEANAKVCTLDDLKSVAPEDWPDLQFQIIPASRIVSSEWNLMKFWKAWLDYEVQSKANENLKPPSKELINKYIIEKNPRATSDERRATNQNILIWRKSYTVYFETIANEEKHLLEKLKQQTRFEDICEMIAEQNVEDPTQIAAQYLNRWLTEELLINLT